MSIYSTIYVTRPTAIQAIKNWLVKATDKEIGDMLDVVLEPHCHNNCIIDSDPDESEGDRIIQACGLLS